MSSVLCATDLKGNPDLLIKEVHVRRPIWDLKSPAHHNRDIVHKLWTEISDTLGLPMDVIKNKWKHLRDNFRTELKKTVRGSGNPPQPYQSQWTFFNDLLFLEEQMMKKISRLYMPTDSSNNECEVDAESNENLIRNSTDFLTHSLFDDNTPAQEPLTWWLQNDGNISAPNGHMQNNKRRRYNYDYNSVTMTILNDNSLTSKMKMQPNSQTTSSLCNDDIADDDYHFMMSLLPFLKSLEAPRKMYLRVKLQELICDFVYNIKCNSNSNSHRVSNSTRRLNKATCTNRNISGNSSKRSEPKNCVIKEEPSYNAEHNQDKEPS